MNDDSGSGSDGAPPMPTTLEDVVGEHRASRGGAMRAAIFGANDGLVSNTGLVMGVAGAAVGSDVILVSGVAGLLAGAFSMAAGEYVSVRSQRDIFEHQIARERAQIANHPEVEIEELALIYAAKGIPKDQARRFARHVIADPETALDTMAREELGLNPDDLGAPLRAAGWSFLSFCIGAAVPLVPFVVDFGVDAVTLAAALAGVSLFGVGAAIGRVSNRGIVMGGLRMLGIGALAGGVTYAIGTLLGVAVG